jgi:hypothetical protein
MLVDSRCELTFKKGLRVISDNVRLFDGERVVDLNNSEGVRSHALFSGQGHVAVCVMEQRAQGEDVSFCAILTEHFCRGARTLEEQLRMNINVLEAAVTFELRDSLRWSMYVRASEVVVICVDISAKESLGSKRAHCDLQLMLRCGDARQPRRVHAAGVPTLLWHHAHGALLGDSGSVQQQARQPLCIRMLAAARHLQATLLVCVAISSARSTDPN